MQIKKIIIGIKREKSNFFNETWDHSSLKMLLKENEYQQLFSTNTLQEINCLKELVFASCPAYHMAYMS